MINVLNPPSEIRIGYVGENNFRTIQFDVSEWLKAHPAGTISIVFSRPDGEIYPVAAGITVSPAEWKPTTADLAVPGSGFIEIRIIDGDVIGKSCKIATRTISSLGSTGDPPLPPTPDWVQEAIESAPRAETAEQGAQAAEASAQLSATSAESSASAASASALSASGSATSASGSATTATTKASESSASAAAALQSEENASTSATAAESAQTATETARTGAQTAETNACTYSTSAGNSATAAAGSAADAQSAQTAAESARDAAATAKTAAEMARDAASSSKTAASTSESNAASSAAAAATSEANAASSAQAAANSAASLVVVNDLTTGGTSKALSAEQGKVLGASISELTNSTVKFSAEQVLTTAQRLQARTNIGAAPVDGSYELIETITLTEDTASVVRTQEPDGTPYSFERLKLMVHTTAATDSSVLGVSAFCGETKIASLGMSGLLNTSDRYSMLEFYDDNNIWSAGATSAAGGLWANGWNVLPTFDPKLRQVYTEINKIQFNPGTASVLIPAGTVISIYGVRA